MRLGIWRGRDAPHRWHQGVARI